MHDLTRPSGLAFSPDYRTLYVSEFLESYDGVYIHAYEARYSESDKAPIFSTGPPSKHAASSSSGSATSAQHHRAHPYATPESSPQFRAAATTGLPSSRSRSASSTRTQEMTSHTILSSMTNGLKSHGWIPRSEPTPGPLSQLAAPFQSTKDKVDVFLSSKSFVAYSPNTVPSGAIATDPVHGDIWLGTNEGVEIWNASTGELAGKILVEEWEAKWTEGHRSKMRGVSKVVFINESEALLLGGERIWRLRMGVRALQFP